MTRDVSPILDRHTQDDIGRKLRERLPPAPDASQEIEALLAALRASAGAAQPGAQRR